MIDETASVVARADIVLAAAPGDIWEVLTDIAKWPDWFPRISAASIDGAAVAGSVIHWRTGAMTIDSRLTTVERGRQLDWDGMRFSAQDAFYALPGIPLVAANHTSDRWLGVQQQLRATLSLTPQVEITGAVVHFMPGRFLRDAGRREGLFTML